jgi:hypothetical protein
MFGVFVVLVLAVFADVFSGEPSFRKITLTTKFYAEGVHYGDFNRDGNLDIVAGPYWYSGPDFVNKFEIYSVESFNPESYSDNFSTFGVDLNGDGWDDVLICPHPGKTGYWYENPQGKEGHWKKHDSVKEVGNESPTWAEIIKGTGNGLLYNTNGYIGFATIEVKDNLPQWTFNPISQKEKRFHRYTHGIGYGDINNDSRTDIIDSAGWWEQPENRDGEWRFHPFKFAKDGAHILVYDVNGDGLNDVVTTWDCHQYGLVWYKQTKNSDGKIDWQQFEILPITPDIKSDKLRFSQMHALATADFNNDGLLDFVTGKRFWAHGSKGDKEPDAAAVLYWFELKRDDKGNANFIPHKIDIDSGVGTQIATVDLNKDKKTDIIISNKKGTFVFINE